MKQLALPIDITQDRHKPESPRLYELVVLLRRRGFRVRRAGRFHTVNGKKFTAHELARFAEEAR